MAELKAEELDFLSVGMAPRLIIDDLGMAPELKIEDIDLKKKKWKEVRQNEN